MTEIAPDPNQPYPIADQPRVCFIKNLIKSANIIVGDYSYYDDPIDPENFEKNVLYNYGNERSGNEIEAIYGVVTTGSIWQFLKLQGQEIEIDLSEYYLKDVNKILGILAIGLT